MKSTMMKFLGMIALAACVAALPAYADNTASKPADTAAAKPANFNSIKFTDDMWDPEIVAKVKELSPKYVSKGEVFTLDPAPLNDSETTKQDLATLHQYQDTRRTPDQIALIKEEVDTWKDLQIDPSVKIDTGTRGNIQHLMSEISTDMLYFLFQFKKQYLRARPTQLDKTLTTVIPIPGHPAYPSAHAGQTHAVALALGYIDPAHKVQYMQNANDIGQRREIAGVHYPSDSRAGRVLADQVFAKMLQNPDFKTKIDAFAKAVKDAQPK